MLASNLMMKCFREGYVMIFNLCSSDWVYTHTQQYIYPYKEECDYFYNCTLFVIAHFFSSTKAVTIGTVVICD